MRRLFIHISLLMSLQPWLLGQGYGDGRDGSPSVSGIINQYTYLTRDAGTCSDSLQVASADGFQAGDLVLIIQMQGARIYDQNDSLYGSILDYAGAGRFELALVKEASGQQLILEYPTINAYSVSGHTQVIRVPQYRDVTVGGTLTCPAWNGQTGGVLVLNALGSINLQADINVLGKGFRGGEHHTAQCIFDISYDYMAETDPQYYAKKGEGIAGFGVAPFTSARGAPANGGGGGNIHTTGGGGGANSGCGGNGGWGYPVDNSGGEKLVFGLGGHAIDMDVAGNRLFAGGGGGAGHEHYGNGTSGANGGGIVVIIAETLNPNGHRILATGASAGSSGAYGDGAGGGGAGGTVALQVSDISGQLTVSLSGGNGGNTISQGFGPGGGGGGGFLYLSNQVPANMIDLQAKGGMAGECNGTFYGGSNGCAGGSVTGFTIPFNDSIPKVYAAFTIDPTFLSMGNNAWTESQTIQCTNQSTGGSQSFWDFGDGQSSDMSHPSHNYAIPGNYTIVLVESNAICADTARLTISPRVELPNIFTPNGDGVNDFFPGISLSAVECIEIHNRWGEIVFTGGGNFYQWDGRYKNTESPPGVYTYTIRFATNSGTPYLYSGNVTLVR